MDIFLRRKKTYTVNEPLEDVWNRILALTKRPWYKFSPNLTGELVGHNSFKLWSKLNIAQQALGGLGAFVLLSGQLQNKNGKTMLHATIRPSHFILLAFWAQPVLLILSLLFDMSGKNNSIESTLLAFSIIIPVFGAVIFLSTFLLMKRAERVLSLQ